jgi:RNA polymerase sigma-70 factor (ECF subfamily)
MDHDDSEQNLIGRAVAGEEQALIMLLHLHYDRLAAHIAARIPPFLSRVTDPVDILQDTFIQTWRHIRTFQPQREGSFYAWLVTIADHKLLDRIKSQNAQKHGGGQISIDSSGPGSVAQLLDVLADDRGSPSQSVMRHELEHVLHIALGTLPDDYREGIWLRYIEGLSAAEVAQRMNRTEHAVHMLCNRGKQMLREVLGRSSQYFSSRR